MPSNLFSPAPKNHRYRSKILYFKKAVSKLVSIRRFNTGFCPICQKKTVFVETGTWLRDNYFCITCKSIPRARALIHVLETHMPGWRNLSIHESSPGSPSSDKMRRECPGYTSSQFFPDTAPGAYKKDIRCENIEALTFKDSHFDLFITQDVLEHVFSPEKALKEIARVIKPGGAHVFSVPWYYWKKTVRRATHNNGGILHHLPAEYHGNPIDEKGSLVVSEMGSEFLDHIRTVSGLTTSFVRIRDRSLGIDGKFIEIFISRKPLP